MLRGIKFPNNNPEIEDKIIEALLALIEKEKSDHHDILVGIF